jgi:hypothetical protein
MLAEPAGAALKISGRCTRYRSVPPGKRLEAEERRAA